MSSSAQARSLLPGQARVDSRLVDQVVRELTQIHVERGLGYYLELGQHLLDRFFDGDARSFERHQGGHASYRALARRDDLPMSKTTLYHAVGVTRQFEKLPSDVARKLPVSHHRALLPLKDDAVRVRLARRAAERGLTFRQLKRLVDSTRQTNGEERRGRPPLPKFQKTLNLLGRIAETGDSFDDLDAIEEIDQETAVELYDKVVTMKERLEDLERVLGERASRD